ncbi:MAG: hypothetical protein PVJ53_01260 [Desulfobacterales bacterium]|jgi:hypothetical protein
MFIPNYQIHNILKDFTQQLKKKNQGQKAGPRLEAVVNKVAETIMDRVARLGEEEARERANTTPTRIQSSCRAKSGPSREFYYHSMDKDRRKVKRCLAVENPQQLIDRFRTLVDIAAEKPTEK